MAWLHFELDSVTLMFSNAMLAIFMSALAFVLGYPNWKRFTGLREWGTAMLCASGGFLLYSQSERLPFFLTFVVANALITIGLAWAVLAHARHFQARARIDTLMLLSAVGMSGVFGVYFFGLPRVAAIFSMSVSVAGHFGMLAYMIHKNVNPTTSGIALFSECSIAAGALSFAWRGVVALSEGAASVTPVATSMLQLGISLLGGLFLTATSVGFVAMVDDRQRREMVERLQRDGLTGLYTRTAFFEMEKSIADFSRTEGYGIILIDIDHFKAVNDTFGHSGGDVVLAHVGRLIACSFRLSDIAVRYGGEEFCVLLRGCIESEVALFAQRLVREAGIQRVRLADGRSTTFTFSAGYSHRRPDTNDVLGRETLSDVVERADQALYRAKNSGRNQAMAAVTPVNSIASIV